MSDRNSTRGYASPPVRTNATTEGVDAQNANEYDIEHGLAGIESKPFGQHNTTARDRARKLRQDHEHPAFSSEPSDDPNQRNPNERPDMEEEIAHPGSHGGAESPGWKP